MQKYQVRLRARMLNGRPVGTIGDPSPYRALVGDVTREWRTVSLTDSQLATVEASGVFDVAVAAPSPPAPRLVCLGGRMVDLRGRHRVIVRGGPSSGVAAATFSTDSKV